MKLLIPLKGYPFRLGLLLALLMVGLVASATMVPGVLGRPSQDETPPQLSEASVNGTSLTLTFNETLDTASIPDVGDFTISVTDSATDTQSTAAATGIVVDGTTVTLTLDYEVRFADTVTLVYTVGTKPIQDAAGNPAAGIGSTDSPYTVDNPTAKKNVWDFTSVTFRSINSDRTYVIAKDDPREFTVENEDEYLDLDVVPVDPRTQLESVRWFRGSRIHYPDISQGDTRIQLPRQGTGTSNFNRAGIRLKTETEELTDWYDFKIFRKLDTTPPSLSTAVINGDTLTLTFSETLDQGSIPAEAAFEVAVTAPGQAVSTILEVTEVGLNGATVTLSLSTTVRRQDTVTLAYTKPQTDPLKDPVNLPVASFTGQDVTNNTPGATDNTLSSLSLSGITLTSAFASATTQYTARVGNDVDQTTVTATPTDQASTVDVSPGDADTNTDGHQVDLMEGANTITATVTPEDTTATAATYSITVTRDAPPPDTTAPLLVTSSASGATLILGYDEELDGNSIPRSSSFIVAVNGDLRTVSAVAVNGKELSLTLNPAVEYGDVLTLAYTIPTGEDAKPLQNLAGLEAPAIPVSMVDNGTPDPTPPELGRVSVTGDTLTLVYDEFLDTESVPAAAAFTVSGNSSTVSAVSVACRTVALTLNSPVAQGDNLTLSYDIPTGENSKPVQNLAGLAAPAIPEGPVTIDSPDTTPPSLMGASVLGDTLTLNFSEDLDEDSVPGYSAFTVTVNEHPRTVSGLSVKCSHVTLTLNLPVQYGDALTLAYTIPTGDGESPVQDLAGLPGAAISSFSPSNETPDTTPPVLAKTSVKQARLTLTYDEALYEDSTPPITAFTVTVNDNSRTLSSVSVSGTDVILTLSPSAEHGDSVTLAYAAPSGNDSSPIRNRAGLAALSIPIETVPNYTPDTTPPTLSSASVTGSQLTFTYDKVLDMDFKPAASDFTVKVIDYVTSEEATATVTEIDLTKKTVTLTLDYHVRFGDVVSLVYSRGDSPIRDTKGNQAANIGTAETPYPIANSSPKSRVSSIESVTFESIISERTYTVPKTSFGRPLTVENEDDQLDVSMTPTDSRAQISSIQWRDRTGTYHSTDISGGDTRVTLPRYGDGQSNYNRVKLDITSEAGTDSQTYYFDITRKPDTTAPSLTSATVDGTSLTLTYNEGLDESSVPGTSDFAVIVVDSETTTSSSAVVSNVTVDGMKVILTLAKNARFGDTVTLNYTKGDNPIEDPAQHPAVDLSGQSVTNETAKATTNTLDDLSLSSITLDPTFSSATTNYTATVPHETGETAVTATPTDSRSTTTVTYKDPDENVFTGDKVTLKVGDTAVTVGVTPEDASAPQKVYTVTVTRLQDTTAPVLVSAAANGSVISLTYNETLDQDSAPGNSAFSITVNGSARTVSRVSVMGTSISLTLDPAVEHGDAVIVSYTIPTGDDAKPIRDTAGNPAPSITDGPVDNQTPDTTPPEQESAFVEGEELTLTYNESLDEDSTPATDSFTVMVNESARDVTNVSITGSQVTLTVNPAVEHGDSVTLTYDPPTGPDANPLQDIAGNSADAIAGLSVDNNTPDTTPPELSSMSVDGPSLTMTYDEPLDTDSKPQTGAFTIKVNESTHTVSAVSIAGLVVTLTLNPGVEHGETVTLTYAIPNGENAKPIMDIAGNPATAIEDGQVQNDTPDTTPPELESASVSSDMLTLTYNEALDKESTPGAGDFTISITDSVTNAQPTVTVTKVAILDNAVTLTLNYEVRFGDTVTLVYVSGANPIQDTSRNRGADIGSTGLPYALTNSTAESEETGIESVTFESVISDVIYKVPKADFGKILTVEHTDDQLDVSVSPTDTRAQITSIQWRDRSGDYHSTNISEGDTRVTLPRHGDGQSNYNRVKIEVESESGETFEHNFSITRKSDTTAPRLTATTVNGATLTLAYDETLDQDSTPESSAFAVTADNSDRTVSAVSVSGFEVVLTLDPPIGHGDTVVLTYTVPTGEGARPIRDLSGVIAPAIRSGPVENQTPDTTPPELISASVDGVTLTLVFNESLDDTSAPATDDFTINVTDSVTGVQSIAVVTGIVVADTTVTLTLDYEVRHADPVSLVYTVGAKPIKDVPGNPTSGIGTTDSPHPVDNPTEKSARIGYASVIFQSINSDRSYKIAESESSEFTVENADEYLKVEVIHTDRRGRTESIEWFDSSARDFKDDGNMVRLRLQGAGKSNRNRVRISLLSEADSESVPEDGKSVPYEFQITREIDVTPPELTGSTVVGDELTLTYNEALDPGSIPAGGDFTVTVVDPVTEASSTPAVSAVKVEDRSVILTLDAPTRFDDKVTLTYTRGDNPIQDPIGNPAANFHGKQIDNETPRGTTNTLIALYMTGPTGRLTLRPIFDSTYTRYSATVANEITQATVTAITTDPRAEVGITPEDGDQNTAGHQVALESEGATIMATVTPEDTGADTKTYIIAVTRSPDTIAPALDMAIVDGPSLTLTYNEPLDERSTPAVGDFSVMVVDSVTEKILSPKVSNVAISDAAVTLTLGREVRHQDKVTLAYTPGNSPIRDSAGNNAEKLSGKSVKNNTPQATTNTLSGLSLNGVTLTPAFTTDAFAYEATVPHEIGETTIAAKPTDPRAAIAIDPADAGPDTNGHQVSLDVGDTTIMITVTPEDTAADAKTYAITITRLLLTDATANGALLTLTYGEALDEDSRPATGDFTVRVVDSVTREISSLRVPDIAVVGMKVVLTLAPPVRYQDRVTLAYTPGNVPIRDIAGNQAEEINNRSITNDTPRSVANTLRALSLQGVTLTPEFSSGVTSYTAAVASDIDKVVVFATAAGPRATVAISPSDSDTGDDGHRARLIPGRNDITVVVIPEDVTASEGRYTIAVHRAYPTPVATPLPATAPVAKPSVPISATPTPQPAPTRTYTPVPTFLPKPTPTLTPRPTNTPTPTPTSTPTPTLTLTPTPTLTPIPVPTGTPTPAPKPVPSLSPTPTVSPIPLATQTPAPSPTHTLQRETRPAAESVERSTPVWGMWEMMPIPTPVEAPQQAAFIPSVTPTRPPVSVGWVERKGQSGVSTPTSEPTPLPFDDETLSDLSADRFSPGGLVSSQINCGTGRGGGVCVWRLGQ